MCIYDIMCIFVYCCYLGRPLLVFCLFTPNIMPHMWYWTYAWFIAPMDGMVNCFLCSQYKVSNYPFLLVNCFGPGYYPWGCPKNFPWLLRQIYFYLWCYSNFTPYRFPHFLSYFLPDYLSSFPCCGYPTVPWGFSSILWPSLVLSSVVCGFGILVIHASMTQIIWGYINLLIILCDHLPSLYGIPVSWFVGFYPWSLWTLRYSLSCSLSYCT